MQSADAKSRYTWLCSGDEFFPEALRAIDAASESVCLETYHFSPEKIGERFRAALVRAQERGATVQVLLDAVGSHGLPAHFWDALCSAAGTIRWFNPLTLQRFWFRNHRKLLVCDRRVAFVGGFNIAPQYEGDGVRAGWMDVGLKLEGPLAEQLRATFDETFARADFRHKLFMGLRRFESGKPIVLPQEQLLLGGPGRGQSPIKWALRRDLAFAREVQVLMGYFLPTRRLRRDLMRVARHGGRVQLILAGKSDVQVSQLAAQSLYRRFLKNGVEVYEYQPQILHAKLIRVDDTIYVGSSNLDQRSLQINYELMVRVRHGPLAAQARTLVEAVLAHCRPIRREEWRASRTLWRKLKQRLAYLLLVRIDPLVARWQWRRLAD
jgi:cardiolipin synthase